MTNQWEQEAPGHHYRHLDGPCDLGSGRDLADAAAKDRERERKIDILNCIKIRALCCPTNTHGEESICKQSSAKGLASIIYKVPSEINNRKTTSNVRNRQRLKKTFHPQRYKMTSAHEKESSPSVLKARMKTSKNYLYAPVQTAKKKKKKSNRTTWATFAALKVNIGGTSFVSPG